MNQSRIWVVGAGAIGCAVAGRLESDPPRVLIDGWREHVEAIRANGLTVEYPDGAVRVSVPAFHTSEIESISDKPDIILLAVKSNDTLESLQRVLPHMAEETVVVSLQNCINEEAISRIVGAARTIGTVVGLGGELLGPGRARSYGLERGLVIGELDGSIGERIRSLASILQSSVRVEVTSNIWGALWTKMVINTEMNAVAAVTGFTTDRIAADPLARRVSLSLGKEAVAVAVKLGYQLDPGALCGLPEAYLEPFDSPEMRKVERAFMDLWAPISAKPSMLQDVEKGRLTEIDFMNGYVAAKAREVGIPAPFNEEIVRLAKSLQAGGHPRTPEVLGAFRELLLTRLA